jgi:hypothetical protein
MSLMLWSVMLPYWLVMDIENLLVLYWFPTKNHKSWTIGQTGRTFVPAEDYTNMSYYNCCGIRRYASSCSAFQRIEWPTFAYKSPYEIWELRFHFTEIRINTSKVRLVKSSFGWLRTPVVSIKDFGSDFLEKVINFG